MKLPVLIAASGAAWEAELVVALERGDHPVEVVRRCVDVVDLLAVAASGQARAALVAGGLRRLDADAVDRLTAAGVVAVGVVGRGDTAAAERLSAMGVRHVVPDDAQASVVSSVVAQAVAAESGTRPARGFTTAAVAASGFAGSDGVFGSGVSGADGGRTRRRGSVIAIWGPTGAPGRTTVAVTLADEIARLDQATLLVDADVYGGVIAPTLGLLDDSPGLAAACRQAGSRRLDAAGLSALCWQLTPRLRVLTGMPRADRWPELRTAAIGGVVAAARELADFTVVDLGFCLETDEEMAFESLAPRRNGATLAMLDAADLVIAVGAADPIGLQRLIRSLSELRDAEISAPLWVVLNKVRPGVVPGDPAGELTAALDRFAGRPPAALLPYDRDGLDAALRVGKTLGEIRAGSSLRAAVLELAAALTGVRVATRPRRAAKRA